MEHACLEATNTCMQPIDVLTHVVMYNVVEVDHAGQEAYGGHVVTAIMSLLPGYNFLNTLLCGV